MQLNFEFISGDIEVEKTEINPFKAVKDSLKEYIKISGLIGFKDYYMKIKYGNVANVPAGLTKDQFLTLAKETYENRALRLTNRKN
jgi:hypothetical protein